MKSCLRFISLLLPLAVISYLHAQNEFATIPATSYRIVDGLTGIEVDVSLSEFMIGATELTQKDFSEITGYNPSFHQGPDLPVENVSWWDAVRYCNLRSLKESLEPCYDLSTGECDYAKNGYRLPTDAEWELADSLGGSPYTLETIHKYGNIGSSNSESLSVLKKELSENATKKVGSYPSNYYGVHDMLGNVWEWCGDYFNRVNDTPLPLKDPQGASWAPERLIRGGSFISLSGNWGRGYRSCMRPDYRSRFTGFRLCRKTGRAAEGIQPASAGWFEPYNRVPAGFENNTGALSSLVRDSKGRRLATAGQWLEHRKEIEAKWAGLLGEMPQAPPGVNVKPVRTFREERYTGRLMYLQVEPDWWEKIFLMIPRKPVASPTPVVIVPYYDIDTPAAKNMGGRSYMPHGVRSFAYLMAQQGYITAAIRWYGESYGEGYAEAVSRLKIRHPALSGLGKWVWDAQRLVDYLYTLPEVDRKNIGIIGHSLGGKMSLYAAAFEPRITAVVASELGIGLTFTNYEDYWYHDESIRGIEKHTDHHELLGLIAPRPFMLISGDSADNDKSWYYINSAREVYSLFGKQENIGCFNHRTGHSPTPESVRLAVEWLKHFLSNK